MSSEFKSSKVGTRRLQFVIRGVGIRRQSKDNCTFRVLREGTGHWTKLLEFSKRELVLNKKVTTALFV